MRFTVMLDDHDPETKALVRQLVGTVQRKRSATQAAFPFNLLESALRMIFAALQQVVGHSVDAVASLLRSIWRAVVG